MRKTAALILVLLMIPVIFGAKTVKDTFIFFDETPGQTDPAGSVSLLPAQQQQNTQGYVVLRMGGTVTEFEGFARTEEWSWQPGRVITPLNPASIDVMDYQGDGFLNDVAYISGLKKVTIRTGRSETDTETLWEWSFPDSVRAVAATDYNGDGKMDDLLVAAGQKIYAFNPATNQTYTSFTAGEPRIIAAADLDEDGRRDDVVVGGWTEGVTGEETTISDSFVKGYSSGGDPLWTFNPTDDGKVIYLHAFDRDSDGRDSDVIAIFLDDTNPTSPKSSLYIVSKGKSKFFRSNTIDASPADFDGDGRMDDFVLLTETAVYAYNSEDPPTFFESATNADYNTSDGRTPKKFIKVTSFFKQPSGGKNVYNDIAIFASIADDQRVLFFVEDFATEEQQTTPTPTPTATPTPTPPPNKPPSAKITGLSEGTTVQEGGVIALSGSASTDPDGGDIVSYQWLVDGVLKKTGVEYELSTEALSTGDHEVTLKVTDDEGDEGVTTIGFSIAKANIKPIAKAGEDVTVMEGEVVTLSAEGSSDPDGEIASYEWSEEGRVFSLDKTVEWEFPVGIHRITLTVTDDKGGSSTDEIVVTVEKKNLPPAADAGEDIEVIEGDTVHLSAKASSDPDGNITSYVWALPDGKTVEKPEFDAQFPVGVYRIRLNVTDDRGAVDTDELVVTVREAPGVLEKYGTEIKAGALTIVAILCAVVIFLRSQRTRGLY